MRSANQRRMNLDRQIKLYEDCISRLEELKRAGTGDVSKVEFELEQAYRQASLLKIRRMMMIL